MGRLCLSLACYTIAQLLLVQAMAVRSGGLDSNPVQLTVQTGDESRVPVRHATAEPPSSATESSSEGQDELNAAQAPEIRRLGRHHAADKSVAGGGVIIGGLVTAIFAAVYCYIRVTGKRDGDEQ